ncbi:MAG: hypothetical protein R6U44_12080 [Archaeoglobaceae archaeon]
MRVNRIIELGLEEKASELKREGFSDYKIAKELSESAGVKVSQPVVWRYFNQNKDSVIQRAKQREEVVEKAIDKRLDVVDQLSKINKAAMHFLKEALQANDSNKAMKAMREVREQLEFQSKLLGDLPDQQININVEGDLIRFEQKVLQIVLEGLCDECREEFSRRMEGYREQLN